MAIINEPGAYQDIAAEDYHGNPDLLPEPSLSSSGAKLLLERSPLHFWHASPMNPARPLEDSAAHFSIGKAAHDRILLKDRWQDHYHVTPEGFTRGATKKFADALEELAEAEEAGKVILRAQDSMVVDAVVAAVESNEFAQVALSNGVAEETLAYQDTLTGVWCRARPDFRPNSIPLKRPVRVVADLKFVAPTNASPAGFAKAVERFGYHQSAAFYWDAIKAVYEVEPTHWLHIVVENESPHCVALYELPAEDIQRGRMLNRRAINLFDRCLRSGRWPGYADEPAPVGLPHWARSRIDNAEILEDELY